MTSITIAGGCYIETCEAPAWRGIFGSGGRAAAALAGLGPVRLCTYYPYDRAADLSSLEASGIQVERTDTSTPLAFAYFHPLSEPVLAPDRLSIPRNPPLSLEGDVVLRFGMLEGDAIVTGRRAVYDPQTVGDFEPFGRNGSNADHIALVLNSDELKARTGENDVAAAAQALLCSDQTEVIVAKGGVRGASVHWRNRAPQLVPAHWSDRVFKIGTGDVFSAAFAHYWGCLEMDGSEAAGLASRSVAYYSASRRLPLPPADRLGSLAPVAPIQDGVVTVFGAGRRLADRWLIEETMWRLRGLGVKPILHCGPPQTAPWSRVGLVLADQIVGNALEDLLTVATGEIVVFSEDGVKTSRGRVTQDFATALYWASWLS